MTAAPRIAMCSQESAEGVGQAGAAPPGGDAAPEHDIQRCRVHRTLDRVAICLVNDEHCVYALPFGNICTHPRVDQIAENDDEFSVISKQVFELSATGNAAYDLDALLGQLFGILRSCRGLPLEQRGTIVLRNARGYFFQVAQYGMEVSWKTDFRWQARLFERAAVLPGGLIRSCSMEDAPGQQLLLLPLSEGNQLIGYTILFAPSAYQPVPEHLYFMASLAGAISSLVQRSITHEILRFRELELEESRGNAFRSLRLASQYRDDNTGWHIMRMTHFAVAIAKAMGLPEKQRELLAIAAPMHDVGKIGIPDAILHKPELLSPEEFEIIKTHTGIGATILEGKDPMIAAARDIAAAHHERWDGSGYPKGLAGAEISVPARICAVADVFDALLSSRPYKSPWPVEKAAEWIESESGKSFDPEVVRAFQAAMPEILRIRELYRDDVIDPKKTADLVPLPPRENAWVQWDDTLSVGIDTIDEHHRYLFDLINDLFEVVKNKRGVRELAELIVATETYAKVHFRAEELMMRHYGYEGLQRQQNQHRAFETRIQEFYEALHDNPLVAQFDILSYLRDWLIHHIRVEDAGLRLLTFA